jgi:hypothetical protein
MEQTNIKTEPQEQQTAPAPRPWVTPTFERAPLDEALSGPQEVGVNWDGDGYS